MNPPYLVSAGRHIDNPSLRRALQGFQQKIRQQKMPEMVDAYILLEAVACRLAANRDDPCIVNQPVQRRIVG